MKRIRPQPIGERILFIPDNRKDVSDDPHMIVVSATTPTFLTNRVKTARSGYSTSQEEVTKKG
jgi:hypothetical protein